MVCVIQTIDGYHLSTETYNITMSHFTKDYIQFFKDLEKNNNKDKEKYL